MMLSRTVLFSTAVASCVQLVTSQSPCALAASAVADWQKANPTPSTNPLIPAELAYDCLQSAPLQKDEDIQLIEELTLYLHWQSNLAYLIDPPEGYLGNRVDIQESITHIYNNLTAGEYASEYDFMSDLKMAIQWAQDYHLNYNPDIVMKIFSFTRGARGHRPELVSVSLDGVELPKVYNYDDVVTWQANRTAKISPISHINGLDVEEHLADWASDFMYHDPDARYNQLFWRQAGAASGSIGSSFTSDSYFDGPWTNITHTNGTKDDYRNYAAVLADISGITSGQDLIDAFCSGPSQAQKRDLPTLVRREDVAPTMTGYPEAVFVNQDKIQGGYYMAGAGYSDTAVLALTSYEPTDPEEFQANTRAFLEKAKKDGKKKLIIDLRNNSGGWVFLGYDTFKQLFPEMEPYGANRYRANEAFDWIGYALTKELAQFTYEDAVEDKKDSTYMGRIAGLWGSPFNYRGPSLDKFGDAFTSWDDMHGPVELHGDNFTEIQRWHMGDIFADPIMPYGYGINADKLQPSRPFEPENIVMLMDGGCGSTCSIFAELMKSQGGVQTITMGGLPKNGPAQGVGGTKGSTVVDFAYIDTFADHAYNWLNDNYDVANTELELLSQATLPLKRVAWYNGKPAARVNFRDAFTIGNDTVPLEFTYEAADCRLFYTPQMIVDPTTVWKAVADARWKGFKGCVEGSTKHKSSLSGRYQ